MKSRSALLLVLPLLSLSTARCELEGLLGDGGVGPALLALAPEVEAGAPSLRDAPSLGQFAAWYCPDYFEKGWCHAFVGARPAESSMRFEFGLPLSLHNPNDFPVPALDVLVGLTLFDGDDAEELGALCLSLCGEDDPECDPTPKPGACTSDDPAIETIEDFAHALPGLIEGISSGEALQELRKSTLPAGGDVQLDLSFDMGLEEAISVFATAAERYLDELAEGEDPDLAVPVTGEGSIFFDLPALGRVGVGYGPIAGTWKLLE